MRLFLAVFCGGIIGLQRNASNHVTGFRTHILVCIGATLAMMTNQYVCENLGYLAASDPTRLGAQVITGVGFLGVGSIIVTGKNKIKGLTTAAGLWASACMGLAIGIGFYRGAIIACLTIYISLSILTDVKNRLYRKSKFINLYIEVTKIETLNKIKDIITKMDGIVISAEPSSDTFKNENIGFIIDIKAKEYKDKDTIKKTISNLRDVVVIERA